VFEITKPSLEKKMSAAVADSADCLNGRAPTLHGRLPHPDVYRLLAVRDAENLRRQQSRNAQLQAALAAEQARVEKQAGVLAEHARVVDNRTRDLSTQFAASFAKLELSHEALVAVKEHKDTRATLEHAFFVAEKKSKHRDLDAENERLKLWLVAFWTFAVVAIGCVVWSTSTGQVHALMAAEVAANNAIARRDALHERVWKALARQETQKEELKMFLEGTFQSRL
jgi:hypothetical protein